MKAVQDMSVKIYADGADLEGILEMSRNPVIKGFTTNPTLMRKAGVDDYRAFAHAVLRAITDRPISFEVLSDSFQEMERQAKEIAGWGSNVYVKIPVSNTNREPSYEVVSRLTRAGIKVNVTAIMTLEQVEAVTEVVAHGAPSYVSIFAGRIADSGRDPVPMLVKALAIMKNAPNAELIWASPRELLNIVQADEIGCHIITATNAILQNLDRIGIDLDTFSAETVRMFYEDARAAGYEL